MLEFGYAIVDVDNVRALEGTLVELCAAMA